MTCRAERITEVSALLAVSDSLLEESSPQLEAKSQKLVAVLLRKFCRPSGQSLDAFGDGRMG